MTYKFLVNSPFKVAVNVETHDLSYPSWQQHGDRDRSTLALKHRYVYQLHENSIRGVKFIDLGLQLGKQSLILLIILVPECNRQSGAIVVQVHPTGRENCLPPNIQLVLFSESGEMLRSVQSRHQDNYIQLRQFGSRAGEWFNIQIGCGDGATENFIIQSL